ncbi:MAG: deoxyribodipyrimidine photo-lyase, partial [Gammaproteobacteria bacterium]
MLNVIFWFRQDLRISDNPGLFAAAKCGKVMPIYIYEPKKTEELYLG